jgi:hypothetical protein
MTRDELVKLEKVSMGLAPPGEVAAAQSGPAREELARMRAEDEDFHRFVFPRTVDAVVASQGRVLRWWPAAVALAALVLALVWPAGPPDDYAGVKGGALGLWVYTLDGAGAVVRVADGAQVPVGASLRFQVKPSRPCHLWLVSVDGAGQVSRLYPPAGEAAQVPAAAQALPGGATLDGVPGTERVLALCTPGPVAYAGVEAAARATPPREWLSATVLLEKTR